MLSDFKKKNEKVSGVAIIFIALGLPIVLVPLGFMIYGLFLMPFREAEHYLKVWENPAIVTATVTDHSSYEDENDTDYRSHVTYVYEGVRYKDFVYEDRDKESDLTPVGTEVTLQISPLDPKEQIKDLKSNSNVMYICAVALSALLVGVYILCVRRKFTRGCNGKPDPDTVRKDINIKIRSRFLRPFMLLTGLFYGLMYWRYQPLFGQIPLIVAGVCGLLWLIGLLRALWDHHCVQRDDLEIRRDVLVEKEDRSDSDGDCYLLYYQSGERKWKVTTSAKNYNRAQVGDAVVAVYLAGRKKPIIHYTHEGNAR